MDLYLLGAGASKSYEDSATGIKMPLANDFFNTFNKIDKIATSGWVLIGDIINYIKEYRGIDEFDFENFNEDIEKLHTEIQQKYLEAISEDYFPDIMRFGKAYNQLVFLFCSVINEIQNGDESIFHKRIVENMNNDDVILTFNWDTLIDKALKKNTKWTCNGGYYIKPQSVYNNGWIDESESLSKILLLKLHGSTNWLSSYLKYDFHEKSFSFLHDGPINNLYIYEDTINPYSCFDGRFMEGYNEFSMGYYPPNLPLNVIGKNPGDDRVITTIIQRFGFNKKGESNSNGITSMPIIIPPVLNKSYDIYGDLFPEIWKKAEEQLVLADRIFILGYSFPLTDISSTNLFQKAFLKRKTIPEIIIINPYPESIIRKFKYEFGIPESKMKVETVFIDKDYKLNL